MAQSSLPPMRWDDAARHSAMATAACFALAFVVGGIAYAVLGVHESYPGMTHESGPLGDAFGATAFRWDADWYLRIAEHGYTETRLAFFPLYPLLIRGLGAPIGSPAVAGLLVSVGATFAALLLLHRLTELELGRAAAARVVWVLALFPTAVFLPAVMTEALFLALTVGAVYSARTGRLPWAVALGAAAALTRNTGVLLVVPIALLYLSADRRPVRHRLAFLVVLPAAVLGFVLYGWWLTGDAFASLNAQENEWHRQVEFPLAGVWHGAVDAVQGLGDLGIRGALAYGDPAYVSLRAVRELAWVAFAAVGLVGAFRRLPPAYGAYAALAMLVPLSAPAANEPLGSFSRYLLVLFPLQMWLAAWAETRARLAAVLVPSVLLFVLYAVELANGRWV